jgi:large subunit ribosomal protein L31
MCHRTLLRAGRPIIVRPHPLANMENHATFAAPSAKGGPRYKQAKAMKKDIHPSNYRFVVFKDMSNEYMFMGKSCANTKDTVTWEDGNEYPLVKLDISHTSHPFYTGKMMLVDTAGRVDKFKKRFAKHQEKKSGSTGA